MRPRLTDLSSTKTVAEVHVTAPEVVREVELYFAVEVVTLRDGQVVAVRRRLEG